MLYEVITVVEVQRGEVFLQVEGAADDDHQCNDGGHPGEDGADDKVGGEDGAVPPGDDGDGEVPGDDGVDRDGDRDVV